MTFYLGTDRPLWLSQTLVPLFVSRRVLAPRKTLPKAWGRWALDSGGFSELKLFGGWKTGPAQYAEEVQRFQEQIGNLDFAATQDWMCEPFMVKKTGLSVAEHQARSVQSYLDLTAIDPLIPWVPVLQGWAIDDYLDHAEQYASAGVPLRLLPRVGVGSVCRRQATREAAELFQALRPLGLRLHGFGLKKGFIKPALANGLASMDSMAWSFRARRRGKPLDGCTHGAKTCAHCLRFALQWRDAIISIGHRPRQELIGLETA